MKIVILFFLIFISAYNHAQIVFNKTSHDFEEINENDERYIDIYLKNTSEKQIYILSVKTPMEVEYLQKNSLIQPDSSAVIRFHVMKRTKGRFDYTIPVYTSNSNEATHIELKGRINSLSLGNRLNSCPTFNQRPAQGNPMDFMLTVLTIDKETGEKLNNSKVAILQNGHALGKWATKKDGELNIKLPLGITYFYATHDGYYPDELGEYVNFKNNVITLALTKKEEIELIVEEMPNKKIENETNELESSEIKEERIIIIDEDHPKVDLSDIIENTQETKVSKTVINPQFDELGKNNFDKKYFKPINVVFVLDVSYSMNSYGRKELMQYSLEQLLKMLRPEDKIGLVSYASDAHVILESTNGLQKENISEAVRNLKISGNTAGGKGIKLGYKQITKNLMKDGQNHLIIITDGAFNKSSGDYESYIKKNLSKRNITMSVVGVKSNANAKKSMLEVAELGKGRFISIEKLVDAQNKLKEEIRLSTFKYY